MGTIYNGSCPQCGFTKDFHIGGGMMGFDLARNAQFLSQHESTRILEMIENHDVDHFLIEKYITECPKCHRVEDSLIIKITDTNGICHTFGNTCNYCHKELVIYKKTELDNIKCPTCKNHILLFGPIGNWD